MAITISFKDGSSIGWKIDQIFPKVFIKDVFEVCADGQELEFVVQSFNHLPYNRDMFDYSLQEKGIFQLSPGSPKKHIRWFGDHARFIVGNFQE